MSREKPQEFAMPCLGRPFQLGMLYDCCNDQLVSSVTLWNQETLKQSLDSKPQKFSRVEIIADNSTESKLSKLEVDENLKLSFLAGLVDVSGAAAYLNDQTSSENQVRINLRYQSTAWIEQLSIGKLSDLDNPDVFKDTTATHFVSAVLYGADAIIVFDQEVSHDEIPHSHGFMKSMVEKLPTICTSGNAALDICFSDTDKRKVQKFQCKVYCDLPLPEIPSTFEGVVNLCKDLPTLLGESDSPQKVWLCPLSKLNSKVEPIMRKISAGLVTQTQDFMEVTHELRMKTSDLMNSEVCTNFVAIKEQLSCFKRRIAEYKVKFSSNLATLIPKIRGGVEEEDELNKLFTEKDASPFSHACLLSWVKGKMSEVKVLENYLRYMEGLKFAFLPGDMVSVVCDPEYNLVISFTFKTAGQHDPYLKRMTTYLQPHATGQEMINPPTPWYNNSKILSNMKVQTRLFKSFAKANEQAKETTFVVTSSSDELSEEGVVIQLYEDCKKEIFEPPSEPGKPSATSITHNCIQVNWSKPKYGSQNVQFYNVSYCDLSSSPEQWKAEKTSSAKVSITVKDLNPQKKYCFKVQAVCKAGFSEVSEVSDPIQTYPAPVLPGKPIVSDATHNSVQLEWSEPQYGGQTVEYYTVLYCDINDPLQQWKEVHLDNPKQPVTIESLASQTEYSFKVQAQFEADHICSDVSDPIKTDPHPLPPGKPIASNVTYNSVQLEWSIAQCAGQNAEFYTISYLATQDVEPKWKESKTKCAAECTVLSDLAAQTLYSVKVHAKFKTGMSLDSEISDPILTYPVPVPPGKPIVSNVTHNSVHLEWSKPQYGEQSIVFYTVLYCDSNDPLQQWKEISHNSPKPYVTIDNLASQTEYSFKVQAQFEADHICSDVSDPIKTDPHPIPPGKPIASNVTYNSVQLEWSKAQCAGQNAEFYTVSYLKMKETQPKWKEFKTKCARECTMLSGLAAQTYYSIKVYAKFKTGMSLDSEISDPIQTYPVPVPPGKPTVSNVTHNSVHLEWSEPQYGGQSVESYAVLFCDSNDQLQQWKEVHLDSPKQSVTIESLASQTEYSFKVQAQFKADHICSDVSDPIKTDPHPIPPGKPIASNVTYNSVQLKWSKPQYKEEKVDCYTIFYHDIGDTQNQEQVWKELQLDPIHQESVTVSSLAPNREYSFQVCAKFESGVDLPSDSSDPVQTYPVPVPPDKPAVSYATHNSVQLEWSKPQYGGQSVEFYTILYCDINDLLQQWKEVRLVSPKQCVLVGKLASQTEYSFKVQAQFKADHICSDVSDPIKTDPHPIPPGKPIASNVTYNSVQLEWSKAQCAGQNAEFYTVSYLEMKETQDVEPKWKEFKTKCAAECTVLSDLAAQTLYSVKVHAKFITGMSLDSEISDPVQTYPVPVPPGKPIVSNVTHNSVQLEWSEPQYGGQSVEFYTILYCDSHDPLQHVQWKEISHNSPKPYATIDNLASQIVHSFKVQAQFKADHICSDVSDPIKTDPHPIPPGKPIASNVTYNSVQLEWSKAQCAGQNAEFYTVSYLEMKETQDVEPKWKESKTKCAAECTVLSDLAAQTLYSVKVHAKFKTGMSLDSEISDPILTYPVPVPPGKPIVSNVTHNSVQLKWSESEYGGQSAESYTVQYCDISDQMKRWKELRFDSPKQPVTVEELVSHTVYSFRVHAHFKADITVYGESSDPVPTYPPPVPPGKPTASSITDSTIQLKWSKAHY